jgi:hypothetical protein
MIAPRMTGTNDGNKPLHEIEEDIAQTRVLARPT